MFYLGGIGPVGINLLYQQRVSQGCSVVLLECVCMMSVWIKLDNIQTRLVVKKSE